MNTQTRADLRAALLAVNPPKQAAAEALAIGATHAEAAEAAGVARETVSRWAAHHPGFQAAYALYRAALTDAKATRLRRIHEKALDAVETGLDAGTIDPLAVLRIVTPPADSPAPITVPTAAELFDAETRRLRYNLPPAPVVRDSMGWPDPLADMTAPTDDERAERLTIERLAAASGLTEAPE